MSTNQKAAVFATAYGLEGQNGVFSFAATSPVSPKHSLDPAL
jgi:hypothetical protein